MPIIAALSMLGKNSSSEVTFSAPDQFGIRDLSDKSLCTARIELDICSVSFSILARDSAISCLNLTSGIEALYLVLPKFKT